MQMEDRMGENGIAMEDEMRANNVTMEGLGGRIAINCNNGLVLYKPCRV